MQEHTQPASQPDPDLPPGEFEAGTGPNGFGAFEFKDNSGKITKVSSTASGKNQQGTAKTNVTKENASWTNPAPGDNTTNNPFSNWTNISAYALGIETQSGYSVDITYHPTTIPAGEIIRGCSATAAALGTNETVIQISATLDHGAVV